MNKITKKSLISTSIFIFLSFSSLYQLFDRPGDVKVWLQCIIASIIASLFQLILFTSFERNKTMNKITKKSLISTSIFFIFIFLSFSSLYQLFDRPGDVKVWLQCIVASIIASLFQFFLHLYHSQHLGGHHEKRNLY